MKPQHQQRQACSYLSAAPDNHHHSNEQDWSVAVQKAFAACFITASLWISPVALEQSHIPTMISSQAAAKEMASGSGSRVNKDPESLLRYGLPINNKEVRSLQGVLEAIKNDIGSKRKSAALDGAKKARALMSDKQGAKLVAGCREDDAVQKQCKEILATMTDDMGPLSAALKDSMDSFQGSPEERDALDRAYAAQEKATESLTVLEENMIPAGYEVPVPDEYSDLPQLKGRATVEMKLKKGPGGSTFDVEGTTFKQADMTMIIDGYVAPVTSGNFVDLVQKGFYNNMAIQRSDGFVVQTGDPDGPADGYVAPGSKSVGNGKNGERLIPLEIFVKGDKAPTYEVTIEEDGRGGQATVLPFSSYGAMGWAREEYEVNTGSSQFFWLLFDSDLTPAGKNVIDGQYPCFGYVVKGADFLSAIQEGDIIVSAKVTEGAKNLVLPKASAPAA